jgi:hypothetical protein
MDRLDLGLSRFDAVPFIALILSKEVTLTYPSGYRVLGGTRDFRAQR